MKEENIVIEDGIGIPELRQLVDLQVINKALNNEEFMQIVLVYKTAIDRLALQAKIGRAHV